MTIRDNILLGIENKEGKDELVNRLCKDFLLWEDIIKCEKGLDAVIKLNTYPIPTFVIGEAKFLSDEGGHQNAQLKDALHLLTSNEFKNNGKFRVIRIAILDGVCWL